MAHKLTTEQFIERSIQIHDNKYSYSGVDYKNTRSSVIVICPIHGEFKQRAGVHLRGGECPQCNLDKMSLGNNEFINKAKEIHNEKYDYSKVKYINSKTKVIIICPEHGEFEQTPTAHLGGQGCPKCFGNEKYMIESFEHKARKIHSNKYNYEKAKYKGAHLKVIIVCLIHGEFEQTPHNHLRGQGCPLCGRQKTIESHFLNTNEFIKRATKIHHNQYSYSKVNYVNSKNKIKIICPKHGEFIQIPNDHLQGHGCPHCAPSVSVGHGEVVDYLKSIIDTHILINDRLAIKPYELDIYIPEYKFAIEYNGLYYHSYNDQAGAIEGKRKHKDKCELCESKNIRLIQINEDEWTRKRDIVKSVLKSKLGLSNRIYARKCSITKINQREYKNFMGEHHLQGHKGASIKLGLFYQRDFVSAMSFNRHPKYGWEITRFANKLGISVVGGASKLLKYFIDNYNPKKILTYADRRYSDGNLYHKLGFKLVSFTNPNYFYVKNKKIYSRQQFQKHKMRDRVKVFNPNLTESENMFNNGFRKLWDAGHHKFLYNQ